MNKKGFTLAELLAVIAILAILATIATPMVLVVGNNIKVKMFEAKEKAIINAAISCAEENGNESNGTASSCNTVGSLCTQYLDRDKDCDASCCQKNPKTGNSIDRCSITFRYDTTKERWSAKLNPNCKNT